MSPLLSNQSSGFHSSPVGRMKIMIWNCRGAGNAAFLRNLASLVARHHPVLLGLLETRVSSLKADRVMRITRFNKLEKV